MGLRHDTITCIVWIPWNPSENIITFSQLNHPPDDHGQERKIYGATPNQTDALLAGWDHPKGFIMPPPKPLMFLDDSCWTMRQTTKSRSCDGKTFVYAIMGMPLHMNTHELWEWLCLWLCWKMMSFLQGPWELYPVCNCNVVFLLFASPTLLLFVSPTQEDGQQFRETISSAVVTNE